MLIWFTSGGETRIRTGDTWIFSPLLYQLSYLAKSLKVGLFKPIFQARQLVSQRKIFRPNLHVSGEMVSLRTNLLLSMKCFPHFLLFVLISTNFVLLPNVTNLWGRTFTAQNGKTLEAKLLLVQGNYIKLLKEEDGQTIWVNGLLLSEHDQNFIKKQGGQMRTMKKRNLRYIISAANHIDRLVENRLKAKGFSQTNLQLMSNFFDVLILMLLVAFLPLWKPSFFLNQILEVSAGN